MWNRYALPAAVVVALSACTHSSPAAAPSPSPGQDSAIWREAAQCAREHGMPDFPDPVVRDGQVQLPAESLKQQLERVQHECGEILRRLPADARRDQPPSATDIQKLNQVAACMRQHGLPDWPDPTAAGRFVLAGTPLQGEGKSARILAAFDACKDGTVIVTVDW
jgi:hypothetical protein